MVGSFVPIEGGCRCGRVRFQIASAPIITMACHCTVTGNATALLT